MRGWKKNKKSDAELLMENQIVINKLVNRVLELEKKYDIAIKEKNDISNKLQEAKSQLDFSNIKYENMIKNELRLKKKCRNLEITNRVEYVNVLSEVEENLNKFKFSYKSIQDENQRLRKMYNNLKRKYDSLSNSKLGSLTLKYWKMRGGEAK